MDRHADRGNVKRHECRKAEENSNLEQGYQYIAHQKQCLVFQEERRQQADTEYTPTKPTCL